MNSKSHINSKKFKSEIEGKKTKLYYLQNNNGIEAIFTNYGQRLVSLLVPDNKGDIDDIVLGYSSLAEYMQNSDSYYGAVIGRYGNRIANGNFSIEAKEFELETNNGQNHLHGGLNGFHNVVWEVNQKSNSEIEFSRTSVHLEEGYPGNLKVSVTYELTDANELRIEYYATTDQTTVVNFTHHSFFNLKGEGNGTINDHYLTINGDHYTPTNEYLIPTGEILKVEGTPFDFRAKKLIAKNLQIQDQQLIYGNGYDHNFVLNNSPRNSDGLMFAAKVEEPNSGRVLEVYTNEPGIQFYGGNFLDSDTGKNGGSYLFRGAFCLETQHFPNSPNQENFPSTLLKPGEEYKSTCVYKFSVDKYQ